MYSLFLFRDKSIRGEVKIGQNREVIHKKGSYPQAETKPTQKSIQKENGEPKRNREKDKQSIDQSIKQTNNKQKSSGFNKFFKVTHKLGLANGESKQNGNKLGSSG